MASAPETPWKLNATTLRRSSTPIHWHLATATDSPNRHLQPSSIHLCTSQCVRPLKPASSLDGFEFKIWPKFGRPLRYVCFTLVSYPCGSLQRARLFENSAGLTTRSHRTFGLILHRNTPARLNNKALPLFSLVSSWPSDVTLYFSPIHMWIFDTRTSS